MQLPSAAQIRVLLPSIVKKPVVNLSRRRALALGLGSIPVALGGLGYLYYVQIWQKSLPAHVEPEVRHPIPPITDQVRLMSMGDWGSGRRPQARVAEAIDRRSEELKGYHAGLLLGDNFYPDGVAGLNDEKWQRIFYEPFDKSWLANLPFYATLGNHDYSGIRAKGEVQIAMTNFSNGRWNMPAHAFRKDFVGADGIPLVTTLFIDNTAVYPEAEFHKDLAWLRAELESLKGASQWVIVASHHPVYSYCKPLSDADQRGVKYLGPLLAEFRVPVYLNGDHHNMQVIDQQETAFITAGCGGKRLYDVHDGPGIAFKSSTFGFLELLATDTELALAFISETNEALWQRTLEKAPTQPLNVAHGSPNR